MELALFHAALASLGLAAIALVFALFQRVLRHAPVDAYRVGVFALASVFCLPVLHVAAEASGLSDHFRARLPVLSAARSAPPAAVEPPRVAPEGRGESAELAGDPADVASLVIGLLGAAQQVEETALAPARSEGAAAREPENLSMQVAPIQIAPIQIASGARGSDLLGRALAWLPAAYAVGLAIALVRLARRLLRTRVLVRSARAADDPLVTAAWSRALARVRVEGARLVVSREVEAPACAGLVERVVVLPEDGVEIRRPEVLECVLLHELVHLERRDAWVQLAEECLCAAFWFHPAAFWLARRLAVLRELACDARVVERTGGRRRYAAVLLEYAALLAERLRAGAGREAPSALVPWTRSQRRGAHPERSKGQLTRRIEMLFVKTPRSARPWRALTHTLAAGLLGVVLCSQLALASAFGGDGEGAAQAGAASRLVPAAPSAPVADVPPEPAGAPQAPAAVAIPREGEARAAHHAYPAKVAEGNAGLAFGVRVARSSDGAPQKLGVVLETPGPVLAAQLGLAEGVGLVVLEVVEGSAAERAGLARFDVLAAVAGEPAHDASLARAKAEWNAGRPLELEVVRGGRRTSVTLPGVEPGARAAAEGKHRGETGALRSDGVREHGGSVHVWPDRARVADAARRYGEVRAHEALESAHAVIAELLERYGIESRGDLARDALEVARRYYGSIDPESFARDVKHALPAYLEELRSRDVDVDLVLDDVRAALESVLADPERYLNATRTKLFETPAAPRRPREPSAPGDDIDGTRRDLDRLRAELGEAMERIQAQMRDLELLHERVQELVERQAERR